jgi:hypothetical protein
LETQKLIAKLPALSIDFITASEIQDLPMAAESPSSYGNPNDDSAFPLGKPLS